jgi:phage terminase Nu1 subunit (DNA packaging protein)
MASRGFTATEMAEIFEVKSVTVRGWVDAGCPYTKRGSKGSTWEFRPRQVHDWLLEKELRRVGVGKPQGEDRSSLAHRKQFADVALREMEMDRKSGALVPIGWWIEWMGIVFEKVNAKLGSVANRAAPIVAVENDPNICQQIIERLVNECREELVGPTAESLALAAVEDTGVRGAARTLQAYPIVDSQPVGG